MIPKPPTPASPLTLSPSGPITAPCDDDQEEIEVSLVDLVVFDPKARVNKISWAPAPFAVFRFSDGRSLEIHVPGAHQVAIAGPSAATAPVFLWLNSDRSVEDSGILVLASDRGGQQ
jgi:hypothetical protein